eukprot:s772_g14.t1
MDDTLSHLPLGASTSLVARVQQDLGDDILECIGLSPRQHFLLKSSTVLPTGVYTFYNMTLDKVNPVQLSFSDESVFYPQRIIDPFAKIAVYDVCSGMGGFAMGSHPLGIDTICFLDTNPVACDALRANFQVPVLHGSVDDIGCIQTMHGMYPHGFAQMTGGFPCQPFSRQGDMQGMSDLRGTVLPALLRCAWLLQVSSVLLECVETVLHFVEIQKLLGDFVVLAGMHIDKIVFDLQDQWPTRRNRFWCLMALDYIPAFNLRPWPSCHDHQLLGQVLPFDAVWSDLHEHDLMWTDIENSIYFDVLYGKDNRVLQPSHKAPTMLHSWANVFTACPCGCRQQALSLHRLLHGGARGFGIPSAKTSMMRHLHPEEHCCALFL